MPPISTLGVFIAAAFVLLVTPGPAVMYIIARSISQGRTAGIVSAIGVGFGAMTQVIAAALGLSAILVSSALAFNAVKFIGAAYLIYLGIQTLRRPIENTETNTPEQRSLSRIFSQGIIVEALNPKTALFFFAFLPQFVDASAGSVTLQIIILGAIFITMGICSDSTYAIVAGTLGKWLSESLKKSRVFWRGQKVFSGGVYIALGLTTALSGNRK